jgi:predicted CoA-binding protein
MRALLKAGRTVAVVGLSVKPGRPAQYVPAYMQQQGYRIIPVNPNLEQALGEKAYPSLLQVPEPVDIVQIFRRSEDVPPVVDQAIAIRAGAIWMQSGIVHSEAAARAEAAGLQVVMDACMRTVHQAMRARGEI